MTGLFNTIRTVVRALVRQAAHWLNRISRGKLKPSTVTFVGLIAHIPIALLIAQRHPVRAALLLIIFGLFDALDGELARLQHRASAAGMLLDATTDRMKEVILYAGVAYLFVVTEHYTATIWAVLATGGSLLVSYVKAKGETTLAGRVSDHATINQQFADGVMRFEVRMVLLILGLLAGHLVGIVAIIALLSIWTSIGRLVRITEKLES